MFELCQKVENCDKRNDSLLCHSKYDFLENDSETQALKIA